MDNILELLKRLSEILPETTDKQLVLATPLIKVPENKKQLRDYCKSLELSNTQTKTVTNKLIPDLITELYTFLHPEGVINHRQIEKLKRNGIRVIMIQSSLFQTPAAVGVVTPMGRIYCQYDVDQLEEIADVLYWGHLLNDTMLENAA